MQVPKRISFKYTNTVISSATLAELERADGDLAPVQAQAWIYDIYRIRKQEPAMREVWQSAWDQLRLVSLDPGKQRVLHSLFDLGLHLADRVEQDTDANHLPYHNSAHVKDVIVLSTHLLQCWFQDTRTRLNETLTVPPWCEVCAACLLLAALCHDWGHDGNPTPQQSSLEELASVRLDQHWPVMVPVEQDDWCHAQQLTGALILSTDFQQVRDLHLRFKKMLSDKNQPAEIPMQDWLSILLTEADIGTGLLPHLGQYLTECVWHERLHGFRQNKEGHATKVSEEVASLRRTFLLNIKLSSIFSHRLGLPSLVQLSLNSHVFGDKKS